MNNLMYDHRIGDGFRTLLLPTLDFEKQLIVTNASYTTVHYKGKNAVTLQRLNKIIKDCDDIETVVLDVRMPRIKSNAYKSLMRLCKDKRIVIISSPHDPESLAVMMSLLSVTTTCKLDIKKFNRYIYMRGW